MILVINAGSSSLKAVIHHQDLTPAARFQVSEIGGQASLADRTGSKPVNAPDHVSALRLILAAAKDDGFPLSDITAVGHRVVHGGDALIQSTRITDAVVQEIETVAQLAPLHNPANLSGIRAMTELAPSLPQFASFDTAFHATNSKVATSYALPRHLTPASMRRYGFHGISYAGLVESLSPLPPRLLAFHLGNGASVCAIKDGRSVASSMGYSPVEGLVMGTRPGSVDPMAVLGIARTYGVDEAERILNRESGLKALAGTSNMAEILARPDPEAAFAATMFCHWAARQGAALLPVLGGVDAVAFTGGIGENAQAIRDGIMSWLAFLGPVPVHVVRADEERQIARDVQRLMAADGAASARNPVTAERNS